MKKRKKSKKTLSVNLKYIDWPIILATIILLGIGFTIIYSITSVTLYNNSSGDPFSFVKKQALGVLLGLIGCLIILSIPYEKIKKLSSLGLLGNIIILSITLIIGTGPGGVKSWIDVGPLRIQPAEFVKIGLVLTLAKIIATNKSYFRGFGLVRTFLCFFERLPFLAKLGRIFISPWGMLAYTAVLLLLLMLQPDLGTGLVITGTGILMVLCSGIKLKLAGQITIIIAVMFTGVWTFKDKLLESHQLERFELWKQPFEYEDSLGYQNIMGYTAIALGGMEGSGLGEGIHKYGYAVEPHNDFIISIVAEELGGYCVLFVMILYFFIFYRMVKSGLKSDDIFASLVCVGLGISLLLQVIINLGGVSGTIPMTGVTLPFISYGGTSVMTTFFLLGVFFNIDSHIKRTNQERLRKELMREYEEKQRRTQKIDQKI